MSEPLSLEELIEAINNIGSNANAVKSGSALTGLPVQIQLPDGRSFRLDLNDPGPLAAMHPDHMGMALLDSRGVTVKSWGLATRNPFLCVGENVLATAIGSFIGQVYEGHPGAMFMDGYRYFACPAPNRSESWVVVMVTNATEERQAKLESVHHERIASVLTTLGTRLSMHQSVNLLAVSAAHEIHSAADLAAVLIWTREPESTEFKLSAHVGVNRIGSQTLAYLQTESTATCIAELVASSRHAFHHNNVLDPILTRDLESKICYLQPGGISVHPLQTADSVLGVLELIGRDGDDLFSGQLSLFRTVAEHLSLALNGAMMFENLERLATHDPLTGIANHRTMQEFLHKRVSEAKRSRQEVGVLMIDVDHFRSFNEEEGHETGDRALKLVATTLNDCLRPYDLAARYGGEEFTAILPGSGPEATLAAAERIRVAIESVPIRLPSGRDRQMTVSIGFAVFPYAAEEPTALLRSADSALYDAKRAGRNRVMAFQGEVTSESAPAGFELAPLWDRIAEEDRATVEQLLQVSEDALSAVAEVYRLSVNQRDIVRGVLMLASSLKRNPNLIEQVEVDPGLRPFAPSLMNLSERFDGAGPMGTRGQRIPLLSRIAQVLLQFTKADGSELDCDLGRFDPQIVAVVQGRRNAA